MPDETTWSVERAAVYGRQLLTGERDRLRGLRDDDLPVLARWRQDPELGALQMTSVVPTSTAAAREFFSRWSANQDSGVGLSIETLTTGDEPAQLIGHLTLFNV